jgi:phosphoribosylanthranilate isomerase
MKVKVKICGIRSLKTAQAAIADGADFIGFNFVHSSKRYIDPEVCLKFIDTIKGKILVVGVFQNQPSSDVNRIAAMLDLDFVQLHGDENNEYIRKINRPVIKSLQRLPISKKLQAQFLLLDRVNQGEGSMIDFTDAKKIAMKTDIFFAGGLTPDNVASVIKKVKPYAVDVASGIETGGREDMHKIKLFIKTAKGVTI